MADVAGGGTRPQIVVVGAGLAGLTTAYYLQRDGAHVTILERARGPGLETSFANGALLHASLVEPWNSPGIFWNLLRWLGREDAPVLLRLKALPSLLSWGVQFLRHSSPDRFAANMRKNLVLALRSLSLMRELRAQIPIEYSHQLRGLIVVSRSKEAHEGGIQAAQTLSEMGLQSRAMNRDELLNLEPALQPIAADLIGGVHYHGDEGGDAHQFCCELAGHLLRHGATIRFNTAVDCIETRGGEVLALRCSSERVRGDAYVLAAASDSALLGQSAGLRLPIRPAKGYSITLPRSCAPSAAPQIAVVDPELHAVVVPVGDDRVRVAGTAEFAGFDLTLQAERINNLRGLLKRLFPDFEREVGAQDITPWAGLRPMCADGVPILGATPLTNLFINSGHGHLGWTLAAGSARLVADVVLGKDPEEETARTSSAPALPRAADYSLQRFQSKRH